VNRSVVYCAQYNAYECKGISRMKIGCFHRMSVSIPRVRLRQMRMFIGHLSSAELTP
jgi:hypothetical protein